MLSLWLYCVGAALTVGCELVKIGNAPTYAMGHDAMLEALKVCACARDARGDVAA